MAPVRIATTRVPPERGTGRAAGQARKPARLFDSGPGGASWVRFGDELVHIGTEKQWPDLTTAARRANLKMREAPEPIDRAHLHVVIQKGRLFQREHPDVPVLSDKGRFLLVDMSPTLARKLSRRKEPCFSVRTLDELDAPDGGPNRIAFAARGRAAAAVAPEAAIEALVDRVSRATLQADLTEFVALPTRLSTSNHYKTACDIAEQKLASFGLAVSRQTINVGGSPSANVVARRDGTGPSPRGTILVSAHLDSVNHEGDAASNAPGADDDASGSAGVIQIARALKDKTGIHDMVFALFGGEEQGLFGSKHFVRSLTPAQRGRVRAVVNMDMIGRLNIATPTVLLEGRALSRAMIDALSAAASTYTTLAIETSLNAANSDHVSFLDKNIPAVLTIEGADSTNEDIHSPRDTLDHINFDLAVQILRMNTAFVVEAIDLP